MSTTNSNRSNKIEYSLILPMFNEAEHIDSSFKRIQHVLKKTGRSWEIIAIDDHSSDETVGKVKRHQNEVTTLQIIVHNKNQGRGATVAEGIKKSQGKIVGFIDIDCEIDPNYIPQFVEKTAQGYDIVCGFRQYKLEPTGIMRYLASKAYVLLERLVLKVDFPDTEAGYKFFKKTAIIPVIKKTKDKRWFWDTEIMVRAKRGNLNIGFIPVIFNRRKDKTSTVHLISDSIEYLKKLLLFYVELRKSQ